MKVLLIQLPVPNNQMSNLPLPLGYLKASADAARIPGLQVELLERAAQDQGGDAFLLDAVLAHDPDLVGFSLYTWNSARALHLARALKEAAPEILTLAGGPEVNRDGDFVLAAPAALDFLVLGEGEGTFVELLQALNKRPEERAAALFSITGLAFQPEKNKNVNGQHPFGYSDRPLTRQPVYGHIPPKGEISLAEKGSPWHFNAPRPAIEDVNLLPSAYLSGALDGFLGRFMMIELSRWCPSKCTFCYYGRQDLPVGGKRYFEIERLRQELEFGRAHGVEQIHFVEANFNTLPHLNQIYQTIQETGANRQMRFYAEMRAEAIDEAEAGKLAECNFGIVECGLQSAVPEVLARVRRKNHLPRLVRGVHLLRQRGIEVFLDAILGLPGDTPTTFRQTLAFIEQNDLAPFDLFHLQILPGTQLKTEAAQGQHGLKWQTAPPYFALQTSELSFAQISQLRRETLSRKGDDPAEIQGLPKPGPFALAALKSRAGDNNFSATPEPVARLIIGRDALEDRPELRKLARHLANEVTLWLRLDEVTPPILAATVAALQILSEPNPTSAWHIFIESARPLTPTEQATLQAALQHVEGYLDRLAVFALGLDLELDVGLALELALEPQNPASFSGWPQGWPAVGLYNLVPWQAASAGLATPGTIWRVEFGPDEIFGQWQDRLEQTRLAPGGGWQLVFPAGVALTKVQALLADFDPAGQLLCFEDPALAAGFYSSQSEEGPLPEFPRTVEWAVKNSPAIAMGLSQTALERAALRWSLARRSLKV